MTQPAKSVDLEAGSAALYSAAASSTINQTRNLLSAERKMFWRVLFLNLCLMFVNYIDRTNLAFASVQLNSDLGITPVQYGLGAGLFFVAYASMCVPAQIMMSRIGGPRWLGSIAVAWGAVAACFCLMKDVRTFLALRFLLGFFEAGALPGMWTYLTHFYNKQRVAMPMGYLMTSLILSQALGAPLAAGLMAMDGLAGLQGWQWLFLLEGALAVLVGIAFFFMPADVDEVRGLTLEERQAVHQSMSAYVKPAASPAAALKAGLKNPVVYVLGLAKLFRDVAFYGLMYWLPIFVKDLLNMRSGGVEGSTPSTRVILLTMIPFAASALTNLINSWHSRRTNERHWHTTCCWGFGALTLAFLPLASKHSAAAGFAVVSLAVVGVYGAEGNQISYYMACMGGEKGIGIGVINSIGSIGGFVGPYLLGALKQASGNLYVAMGILAMFLGLATIILGLTNEPWAAKYVLHAQQQQQEQQLVVLKVAGGDADAVVVAGHQASGTKA